MRLRLHMCLADGTDVRDMETDVRVWHVGDLITVGAGEQYRVIAVADRDPQHGSCGAFTRRPRC